MKIFKTDEATKLQSEVDRLERKRAALAGRLVSAQSAETAAIEARRRHLVESDDEDISTGAKFSAAVDAANRDRIAIEDAISELDKLIAEGAAAVTAAKEASERQKRAAEISKKIERLEPLAATAERQFEALIGTLEKIAETAADDALDVRQYVELRGHGDRLPASSLVTASLAESIFHTSPDLLTVTKTPAGMFARAVLPVMTRRHGGLSVDLPIDKPDDDASFIALPLSGALTANLIDPLKQAASEIMSGARPLATARPIDAADDDDAEPAFGWRRLVLTKPIKWRDWRGESVTTPDADATIPAPVADAAIKAGIAFEHSSREAEHHLNNRYERGFHNSATIMNKDGLIDLQVRWPSPTKAAA